MRTPEGGRRRCPLLPTLPLFLTALCFGAWSAVQSASAVAANDAIRFATYNASLNRARVGQLTTDLSTRSNAQARVIAEVIQRVRPDVLLINEFDYDARGEAARLFQENYLGVSQNGAAPIRFAHRFTAPVNTGLPSGQDLDNDGRVGVGGGDALGFGAFPGQFGLVVYSRFPIDTAQVRTFQHFLWKDMPGASWPDNPATPEADDWYSAEEKAVLRLSSKSHWDLPLRVDPRTRIHFLVSHPTPPSFDGPEDRNGRRNHDEIRFFADYVDPQRSAYIVDDRGQRGGLAPGASFVIAGDQNADPNDGGSFETAIRQLLEHPRVNPAAALGDKMPASAGAADASRRQGGTNLAQRSDPRSDTADFAERSPGPGNLRADYVLPSRDLEAVASGVFWPAADEPLFRLINDATEASSDHRLVWVDVRAVPPSARSTPTGQ